MQRRVGDRHDEYRERSTEFLKAVGVDPLPALTVAASFDMEIILTAQIDGITWSFNFDTGGEYVQFSGDEKWDAGIGPQQARDLLVPPDDGELRRRAAARLAQLHRVTRLADAVAMVRPLLGSLPALLGGSERMAEARRRTSEFYRRQDWFFSELAAVRRGDGIVTWYQSFDGINEVDILLRSDGLFMFVAYEQQSEDGVGDRTFRTPVYWSGLYADPRTAANDAKATLPWLRDLIHVDDD
jgi:hypothetical protein